MVRIPVSCSGGSIFESWSRSDICEYILWFIYSVLPFKMSYDTLTRSLTTFIQIISSSALKLLSYHMTFLYNFHIVFKENFFSRLILASQKRTCSMEGSGESEDRPMEHTGWYQSTETFLKSFRPLLFVRNGDKQCHSVHSEIQPVVICLGFERPVMESVATLFRISFNFSYRLWYSELWCHVGGY